MSINEKWELAVQGFDDKHQVINVYTLIVMTVIAVLVYYLSSRKHKESSKVITTSLIKTVSITGFLFILWFVYIGTSRNDMQKTFFEKNKDMIITYRSEREELYPLKENPGDKAYVRRDATSASGVVVHYMVLREDGYEFKELLEGKDTRVFYQTSTDRPTIVKKTKDFANEKMRLEFEKYTHDENLIGQKKVKSEYSYLTSDANSEYVISVPEGAVLTQDRTND